ncbi:MAG: capsule biosynthesis protein CapA, partial [Pseudomonadota bacterium]
MGHNQRRFLMLQGPHGPFFRKLGQMLRQSGSDVWRVGFNMGDRAFWGQADQYIAYTGGMTDWQVTCAHILAEKRITDLVVYGDSRPVHATAISLARAQGVTVHVFEEGYLRPYWATYERGGSNGNSRLMHTSVADMTAALGRSHIEVHESPTNWGSMYSHVVYGFLYHLMILLANKPYRAMRSHRELPVAKEFWTAFQRILLTPFVNIHRNVKTRQIARGGYPYHLVLMQLEHDSAFQDHSPFHTMPDFLETVICGFAKGAPGHHHLVFKAHPLESGRRPLRRTAKQIARKYGVAARVHYVPGGKLARILDNARTAITVNSTAAQQVLWRGIPLKIFGASVYDKPEFVSDVDIVDFFKHPTRPDTNAYRDYRQYLLETSQVSGGFYSAGGRRQLLRQVVDMMLS